MLSIEILINRFFEWSNTTYYEYEKNKRLNTDEPPFYFPDFVMLRTECEKKINSEMNDQEMDLFLIGMALDNEAEIILDSCKDIGTEAFLARLVQKGCQHPQPDARWQIAELLRCRNIPSRQEYLLHLCGDTNEYVRRRASNSLAYIGEQEKGQGDGSVVPE